MREAQEAVIEDTGHQRRDRCTDIADRDWWEGIGLELTREGGGLGYVEDVAGPGQRSCTQNLKLKITGHTGGEAKGGQSSAETERPGDVGISGRAHDLFLFSFPGGQGHWPQEQIRLQWGTPTFTALSQEGGRCSFLSQTGNPSHPKAQALWQSSLCGWFCGPKLLSTALKQVWGNWDASRGCLERGAGEVDYHGPVRLSNKMTFLYSCVRPNS